MRSNLKWSRDQERWPKFDPILSHAGPRTIPAKFHEKISNSWINCTGIWLFPAAFDQVQHSNFNLLIWLNVGSFISESNKSLNHQFHYKCNWIKCVGTNFNYCLWSGMQPQHYKRSPDVLALHFAQVSWTQTDSLLSLYPALLSLSCSHIFGFRFGYLVKVRKYYLTKETKKLCLTLKPPPWEEMKW